jgi:hypothetical protein
VTEAATKSELSCLPPGLTPEESDFVYHVEVLGLPPKKAAQLTKYTGSVVAPHIMQARELVKTQLRGSMVVTREDATAGLRDAIDRAKLMGEPMTEIAGWDRLIKLHGLDQPQKVDVNIHSTVEVLTKHVRTLSDEELVKALGAGAVIDGDFYEVAKDR